MYALLTIKNDCWSIDYLFWSVTDEVIDEMRNRLRYGATGYIMTKVLAEIIDGKFAIDQFDEDGSVLQDGVIPPGEHFRISFTPSGKAVCQMK